MKYVMSGGRIDLHRDDLDEDTSVPAMVAEPGCLAKDSSV